MKLDKSLAILANKLRSTVLVFCALLVTACQQEEPSTNTQEIVRPAKIIEVIAGGGVKEFTFPAIVQAATSRDLTFQVSGQIQSIKVKGGDEIKKGEIIAQLDQRRFQNDLQAAQTSMDSAKTEYERAKRLIKENAISRSVYDQRKAQLEITTAQFDSAQKSLSDTTLYSPFDGIIATVQGKELESTSPSQAVVTLQTHGAAEAVVKIPANIVAHSQKIEPVDTFIVLDSAPEYPFEASFLEASAIADQKSQTFEVRFSFTPSDDILVLPGMTGLIRSKLQALGDQEVNDMAVPLSAIQSDGSASYVWLVDEASMTVSRQDIVIASGAGEVLSVESGLQHGDLIVGAGAAYLHEGMKIRRLEE